MAMALIYALPDLGQGLLLVAELLLQIQLRMSIKLGRVGQEAAAVHQRAPIQG